MTTAVGVRSDFVIPTLVQDQQYRTWMENLNVFNAASRGAIVLNNVPAATAIGENVDFARFTQLAQATDARGDTTTTDPTTKANVTALKQSTGVAVNQKRLIGPVAVGVDAIVTGKTTREAVSMNIGQQFAELQMIALRNNGIAAALAATSSIDTPTADCHTLAKWTQTKSASAKKTITPAYLLQMLALMGDAAEKILVWVMPSSIYFDLVAEQIANYKIDSVAGWAIAQGSPITLNRPVLVADVGALTTDWTSSYFDKAFVLGLGAGAIQATIKSDSGVVAYDMMDTPQVQAHARQDYWVEWALGGMKWVPGSIHNPTDAQLATAGNWDEDYQTHKECPIIAGTFNISAS